MKRISNKAGARLNGKSPSASAPSRKEPKARLSRSEYFLKYNKVRNERYQNDPEYRKRVIEQERERYNRRKGSAPSKTFGANAGRARDFAASLKLYTEDDTLITMAVLPVEAMAEFLGISSKILRTWIRSEKFPEPNKRSKCNKRVYTCAEANALATVLRDNLQGRASLRPTDEDVIKALFAAYEELQ